MFSDLSLGTVPCYFGTDTTWCGGIHCANESKKYEHPNFSKCFFIVWWPCLRCKEHSHSGRFNVVSAFVNAAEVLMSLVYFYVPVPEFSSSVFAAHAWMVTTENQFPSLIPHHLQSSTWLYFLPTLCTEFFFFIHCSASKMDQGDQIILLPSLTLFTLTEFGGFLAFIHFCSQHAYPLWTNQVCTK